MKPSLTRGSEGRLLAHLGDQGRARLRQPLIGADHRHAAVVAVERVTALTLETAVDRPRVHGTRVRAGAQALTHERAAGLDQVHLTGRAEARGLEHDPVEPLEAQIGRELADLLAVLVEQRRADRDRRMARELGVVDRLHGRDRRGGLDEVLLVCHRGALVLLRGRHPDDALLIQHEVLLGVRGLAHHAVERAQDRVVRLPAHRRARRGRQHLARQPLQLRVAGRLGAAEELPHEDDVSALVVEPVADRPRLLVGSRLEPVVDGALQRAARTRVGQGADRRDHEHREDQERAHEPHHQAAPRQPEPAPHQPVTVRTT